MRSRTVMLISSAIAIALVSLADAGATPTLGSTTLISTRSGAVTNGSAVNPSLSRDGRFVAFLSNSTNLAVPDGNMCKDPTPIPIVIPCWDVYVKDLLTDTITQASVSSSGALANDSNGWPLIYTGQQSLGCGDLYCMDVQEPAPTISSNGRYVAFQSYASNLIPEDTNNPFLPDVFIHDMASASTSIVSASSTGTLGNGWSAAPSLSADGKLVAFASSSNNLVAGDSNGVPDVFVKNLRTGEVSLASIGPNGELGNRYSGNPSLSPDGRYLAFASTASNWTMNAGLCGDDNPESRSPCSNIYLRDLENGVTWLIGNPEGDGDIAGFGSWTPDVSSGGTVVTFVSDFRPAAGPTEIRESGANVWVADRGAGTLERLTQPKLPEQDYVNAYELWPSISDDGGRVTFSYDRTLSVDAVQPTCLAIRLHACDQVYLYDRTTKALSVASVGWLGVPPIGAFNPRGMISGDGTSVVFWSTGQATFDDKDGAPDVFLRKLGNL